MLQPESRLTSRFDTESILSVEICNCFYRLSESVFGRAGFPAESFKEYFAGS